MSGTNLATTLHGDAAEAKQLIEGWIGNPASPYWRGDGEVSAEFVQATYRDLLRGEQQGAAGAVSPAHDADLDHPRSVGEYNIAGAAGAGLMTAADREVVDAFVSQVAHPNGFGQVKTQKAIGWVLTGAATTVEQFRSLAIAAGWSNHAIDACVSWYRREAARRGVA